MIEFNGGGRIKRGSDRAFDPFLRFKHLPALALAADAEWVLCIGTHSTGIVIQDCRRPFGVGYRVYENVLGWPEYWEGCFHTLQAAKDAALAYYANGRQIVGGTQ